MRTRLLLWIALLAASTAATAAEIHGTVSENGTPLAQGVKLKLACDMTAAEAKTDEFGAYSLQLAATGECRLSVDHKGQTAYLTVTLHEKPTRYDLMVTQEAGKLVLQRKE
jgi:hypothetical protein